MNMELANKIKHLKPSQTFTVRTQKEQREVLSVAKNMQRFGYIKFSIVSRKQADGTWKVGAV